MGHPIRLHGRRCRILPVCHAIVQSGIRTGPNSFQTICMKMMDSIYPTLRVWVRVWVIMMHVSNVTWKNTQQCVELRGKVIALNGENNSNLLGCNCSNTLRSDFHAWLWLELTTIKKTSRNQCRSRTIHQFPEAFIWDYKSYLTTNEHPLRWWHTSLWLHIYL